APAEMLAIIPAAYFISAGSRALPTGDIRQPYPTAAPLRAQTNCHAGAVQIRGSTQRWRMMQMTSSRTRLPATLVASALWATAAGQGNAVADEGGTSFWLPGSFANMVATPQEPGWSLTTYYLHASASAGRDVALARLITIGGFSALATLGLSARLRT